MLEGYKDPCSACTELEDVSPDFTENGVTDRIRQNFHDNKGLETTDSRKNCADFQILNDCLIGGQVDKLDTVNTCDLPKALQEIMINVMDLVDLLISSDCGQWDNIESLWDEIRKLWAKCADLQAQIDAINRRIDGLPDWANAIAELRQLIQTNATNITNNSNTISKNQGALLKVLNNLKTAGHWTSGTDVLAGNMTTGRGIAAGTINIFGGTPDGSYFIRTNSGSTENDLYGG